MTICQGLSQRCEIKAAIDSIVYSFEGLSHCVGSNSAAVVDDLRVCFLNNGRPVADDELRISAQCGLSICIAVAK